MRLDGEQGDKLRAIEHGTTGPRGIRAGRRYALPPGVYRPRLLICPVEGCGTEHTAVYSGGNGRRHAECRNGHRFKPLDYEEPRR